MGTGSLSRTNTSETTAPANAKPGTIYKLNGTELASRLSFFLWSSVPDDELLNVAEQGKLSDPKVLEAQVRRMLADPRSKTLASNFLFQWLDMGRLDAIVPDNDVFPSASGRMDPRNDFRTELTLFADSIFREDRSVLDLMRANYTYLNERVAVHYGITDVNDVMSGRQSSVWPITTPAGVKSRPRPPSGPAREMSE